VLMLVMPKDEDVYRREAGLALDAIVLMSNVLSRDTRLNTDI
jgi:hypothetical protein